MSYDSKLIDFHSHILPGADHGSRGLTETKQQLEIVEKAGVDTIVATPHFYPNSVSIHSFLTMIESCVQRLSCALPERPRICLGAEVLYCDHIEKMEGLASLCIRGTRVLLLELPMSQWNTELFYTVEKLTKDYTVVLAHIDRYVSAQADEIAELLHMGAHAQINGYAFSSLSTRHKLKRFLDGDSVVALGSDLHGVDKRNYDRFLSVRKHLGSLFDEIMLRSQALLQGTDFLSR